MGGGKKKKLDKLKREAEEENRKFGFGVGGIEFQYVLMAETDRGCALVAAEFLSDGLEFLLRGHFTKNKAPKRMQEQLVGNFMAPLGTFGMRAVACRAFGIINEDIYDAIEAIREIRNACGHRRGAIDLHDTEIEKYVRWLAEFNRRHPTTGDDGLSKQVGWPWWDDFGRKPSPYSKERTAFMDGAFTVHDYVQSRVSWLEPDNRKVIQPPLTAPQEPKESRPPSGPQ